MSGKRRGPMPGLRRRVPYGVAFVLFHCAHPAAQADDTAVRPDEGAMPPDAAVQVSEPEKAQVLDLSFDGPDADAGAPVVDADAQPPPQPQSGESFWSSQVFEPTRVTLAQEASYKVESPDDFVKNRSSLRVEYSKYFLEHFFAQFDAKTTRFLGNDHRKGPEGSDTRVSQAYLQSSFLQTSVNLGIQAVAWGESILAPITDEVSPRDNRELFNFNLEELRIGQPMVSVDQYSGYGRWSVFYIPRPSFNKNPEKGSAYYFSPFGSEVETVRAADDGRSDAEYGASWRKSFGGADVSAMVARLIDNDYALRMDDAGRLVQEKIRYTLAGMTFSYTIRKFLFKGEVGVKSPKAYNDAALQIVKRDAVDSYLGVEYRHSPTLSMGIEGLNQHVSGWDASIRSAPRNRQSVLFTVTKLMKNDDLSINMLNFINRPDSSTLTMLLTTLKWNDNVTLGLNVIYPYTRNERSGLWNVRDQKQIAFKFQYQF